MKMLYQGAEAKIFRKDNQLIKHRIKKSYRISEIDAKLIKNRTKLEAKLLSDARRAGVNTPIIIDIKENEIVMEFIEGTRMKELIYNISEADGTSAEHIANLAEQIGKDIAKLHEHDIIHGDLTTSNLIYNISEADGTSAEQKGNNIGAVNIAMRKNENNIAAAQIATQKNNNISELPNQKLQQAQGEQKFKNNISELPNQKLQQAQGEQKFKNDIGELPNQKLQQAQGEQKFKNDIGERTKQELQKEPSSQKLKGKIFFIDFGLGFFSKRIEDKATDLAVLKEALKSTHFKYLNMLWDNILKGYNANKQHKEVLNTLEKIEKRGRYVKR